MDTHDLQHLQNQPVSPSLMDESVRRRAEEEFGLELGLEGGRLILSQHNRRQWGVTFTALLIGLGMCFLPTVLPEFGFPTGVVEITAYTFGASLILLAAYLPFTAVDLEVSRRQIDRVRRWSGIRLKRRTIAAEALDDLFIDTGRAGTIGRSYDLIGRGEFGAIKLIDDIPDREFLDVIRRQIMLAAGFRPSGTH